MFKHTRQRCEYTIIYYRMFKHTKNILLLIGRLEHAGMYVYQAVLPSI
jgi:hypothetical protein